MKTREEIENAIRKAMNDNDEYNFVSYNEAVIDALQWVLDNDDDFEYGD